MVFVELPKLAWQEREWAQSRLIRGIAACRAKRVDVHRLGPAGERSHRLGGASSGAWPLLPGLPSVSYWAKRCSGDVVFPWISAAVGGMAFLAQFLRTRPMLAIAGGIAVDAVLLGVSFFLVIFTSPCFGF